MFALLTGITSLMTQFSALPAMISLRTPLEYVYFLNEPSDVLVLDKESFQILQKWNESLKQLKVYLGTLKKIEDCTFIWISNLLILDLDDNQIQSLAKDAFHGLNSLEKLILSRNLLVEIPNDALQVFRNSASLQHLDISLNKIIAPTSCGLFSAFSTSLTYLNIEVLYKTGATSTQGIAALQRFKHLVLTTGHYSGFIIESKQSLPSLQTLHIINPYLLELAKPLCTLFPNLKIAVLSDANIGIISLKCLHLQACSYLKGLDLSGALSMLNSFNVESFNINISNLETLNLARNKLSNMKLIFFIKAPKLVDLDLSDNRLTTIDSDISHEYPYLVILNVNNNELASLFGLQQLTFLQNFSAANNEITTVPAWFVSRAGHLETLDLSNNPFQCNCDNELFRKWISSDKQTWLQPGRYVCASPENLKLMSITTIELDCRSKTAFYISTTIPSVLLFCTMIVILFRYRWHIKYKLFLLYRNYRPFPDIADDFEMLQLQYHAYVAYNENSAVDDAWVMNDLQPNMEEGPEPLKLCIKSRNFTPGHFLLDSIDESIHQSRKTILVLSPNFVDSEWCYHEMRMAQMRLFDDNLDVLVLVLLNEIPENKMTLSLRHILCQNDYLKWPKNRAGQNLFWQRLRQEIKRPVQVDRCFHI